MHRKLHQSDWLLIALCIALTIAAVGVVARYFDTAFPQAAIDFRFDRETSTPIAERLVKRLSVDTRPMKHAASFDGDDNARIFLERSLGLEEASRLTSESVRVWYWHHRWFRPLVEEEVSVDVAPTGEVVAFHHTIPEERALPGALAKLPEDFLISLGVDVTQLQLVDTSERRLPHRIQRIYTWESASIRPAGAAYRHTVTVDGTVISGYSQRLRVPDVWLRGYSELRSKNSAAGSVDLIFMVALMIAAIATFIARLRRGELALRFLAAIGIASVILVGADSLNSIPSQLASYETTQSYAAFVAQRVFFSAVGAIGTAMLLIVVCGAGEVLYRQRLPKQLAMPRLWNMRALASRRVFLSFVIGYTLVPLFVAYQVVFYLVANHYGAWAPAEVPYDDILNSALPWAAVMFAGFFPAFSEEFLSRAFSIPFIQRVTRSRLAAILLSAFIWGFGHSGYPNQPFWIRGVEVGFVGIVAGLLMERFGLLPLLIWHYTVDSVYTASVLLSSGNTYYAVSAGLACMVFVIPFAASIVLYIRNKGFIDDAELSNEKIETAPAEEVAAATPQHEVLTLAPAAPLTRTRIAICIALVVAAAIAIAFRPRSPQDAIDYRITKERAKEIARTALPRDAEFAYAIAAPVEGFRSWNRESAREEGGSPAGFDNDAATWLVRRGMSIERLLAIFRTRIEAGTWTVRFFSPLQKEEAFIEVDPRTSRVIGYHKYQDEARPAASLTQNEALPLARAAFQRFGVNANAFDLKEALSFQQPARRDWLFHFDERTPLAPHAFRRVSVRVAGAEVTQFHKTIKVPESVYREAETQTLMNLVLFWLKMAGYVALLALVIAGLVVATRANGLPWRRAARWTLFLAIIPLARFFTRSEDLLFRYSTNVAWETFRVGLITEFVRQIGMQSGLIFLALAGIDAVLPNAFGAFSREGRARFGRGAAVAALTAISIVAVGGVAGQYVENAFPAAQTITLDAPSIVATPLPALFESAQAFVLAIIGAAAVALFVSALPKHTAIITIIALFFAMLDPSATTAQLPLMLIRALAAALIAWLIARHILGTNPLAWLLTLFLATTLEHAATLLANHRLDLTLNGIMMLVIAAGAVVWAAYSRKLDIERIGAA
ncbi:MAG: lysostaphin resistance A-like protein [Acidobacteriota bacterium]|nr:lysostaphin resistance A-like protein [Acidobacteriota bacterium]